MRQWHKGLWVVLGIMLVLGALADVAMRFPPAQIRDGQVFVYGLYVNVFGRMPLLLMWVGVIAIAIVAYRFRGGWSKTDVLVWLMLTMALGIFALMSPIVALLNGSNAVHIASQSTSGVTYHLYSDPTLNQRCDVILVACDGLLCRFVQAFDEPICLSNRSPYRLMREGETVVVLYGMDEVMRVQP